MAYRGRVLVELQTILDEEPTSPVEDINADDVLRVQVQLHFTNLVLHLTIHFRNIFIHKLYNCLLYTSDAADE